MKYENQFVGKTCIVTAAASGIGKATAIEMAVNCGANVVIADINEAGLKTTLDEILAAGGKAVSFAADLSTEKSAVDLVKKAVDTYGKLDCLVSAVARMAPSWTERDIFFDNDEEYVLQTFSTNVVGGMMLIKHAAPEMIKTGGGAIVCVSSIGCLGGAYSAVVYGMTKAALEKMILNAANIYGKKGVRVNGVRPYMTLTPAMTESSYGSGLGLIKDATIMNPDITGPEKIANVISFLLTDDAYTVQGAIVPVDNGYGGMANSMAAANAMIALSQMAQSQGQSQPNE